MSHASQHPNAIGNLQAQRQTKTRIWSRVNHREGTRGQGDKGTRGQGQGDKGTRGQRGQGELGDPTTEGVGIRERRGQGGQGDKGTNTITHYHITHYPLPITHYPLPTTNYPDNCNREPRNITSVIANQLLYL
ncbi:hypothetical protein [Chroococcidiopsis cubana]|uniref:hypothetical protein n=1 Tax=Chroococcidiopsis cubana TaxID=171392 RepID=UPI002ACDAFBC|nr:hypothetical protein [Chroococcidiopsis cubana]